MLLAEHSYLLNDHTNVHEDDHTNDVMMMMMVMVMMMMMMVMMMIMVMMMMVMMTVDGKDGLRAEGSNFANVT